jgi:hypothetical protein
MQTRVFSWRSRLSSRPGLRIRRIFPLRNWRHKLPTAVKAVIWGMLTVNYDPTGDVRQDFGEENEIIHWSRPS